MDFDNSQTLQNCTRAFSAECADGAKYQYMADEATQQKLSYVSSLLKQLATNEMAHAKIFFDYIGKNTKVQDLNVDIKASFPMAHAPLEEMLNIKAQNELKQAEVVYPAFEKVARKEGFNDIADKMEQISKIEAVHEKILNQIYKGLKNKSLYQSNVLVCWKCNNCGYEQNSKKAWTKCPLCQKDQGYVRLKFNGQTDATKASSADLASCNCKTCVTKPQKPQK